MWWILWGREPLHTCSHHSHGPRSHAAISTECLEIAWIATNYEIGWGSCCGRIYMGTLPDAQYCTLNHYSIPSTIRCGSRMGKSRCGAVSMVFCQRVPR